MDRVKFKAKVGRILFQKNDFIIASAELIKNIIGEVKCHEIFQNVTVMGNMNVEEGQEYIFEATEQQSEKYGTQYRVLFTQNEELLNEMNDEDFKTYVSSQIGASSKELFELYSVEQVRYLLDNEDIESLTSVKGVGEKKAQTIIDKYKQGKRYSLAYVEFGKWGFGTKTIEKIVEALGSVEVATKKLKDNPYSLIGIKGIGFKTIDEKALEFGIAINDTRRVRALIQYRLENLWQDGQSWVPVQELLDWIVSEINNVNQQDIVEYLRENDTFYVFKNQNTPCVMLQQQYDVEKQIAFHIDRLQNRVNDYVLQNVEETVCEIEKQQGWEYAPMQKHAIDEMINNNVFMLVGVAGSGKSSTLNAVTEVFKDNDISFAQCALSGKASDNLTKVTGVTGSTIHRLLKVQGDSGKFTYNSSNPLPYDVVILDEVSMVDTNLFLSLISAIRNGGRLIMVGDAGQLDSIGVGVMRGFLQTDIIPSVQLTEIHRQAQSSAIITHSLDFREGMLPQELITKGKKVYGDMRDLGYAFVNADNEQIEIHNAIMSVYKSALRKFDLNDIQVISPTTKVCEALNEECQKFANPAHESKKELVIKGGKDFQYTLRVGDKVINIKNNRKIKSVSGEDMPIYNGNTGILQEINDNKSELIIDFDGIGTVIVPFENAEQIRLGYAITVHKSQGSTIKCVLVALPFQFKLNTRELLYTAITRASQSCYVATSSRTLRMALKKTGRKVYRSLIASLLMAQKG